MSPKKLGKAFLCRLLEAQVKRLRRHSGFKLIAVAGSVGKTSTKLAIARTLGESQRVIYQNGNYNDRLTVPLVLFGQTEPSIFNGIAWLKLLLDNQRKLRQTYPYDIAVVELGTDAPGQLAQFAYLRPDLTVITAVADEHMEYFLTLDAVAEEEMTPLKYSSQTLLNLDDIATRYLPNTSYMSYAARSKANYMVIKRQSNGLIGQQLLLRLADGGQLTVEVPMLGESGAKIVLAAAAAAHMLQLTPDEVAKGLQSLTPVAGRMQVLPGKQNSSIIDDTYNASPASVLAALDVLQSVEAPQRIAILGSMNELGALSVAAHRQIGAACDPKKIHLVVTIGVVAERYLAPAAQASGCVVESFKSPREAGAFVEQHLQKNAIILVKGSQNGVFAEEALKLLLANKSDEQKLVRQSAYWMKRKQAQFPVQ